MERVIFYICEKIENRAMLSCVFLLQISFFRELRIWNLLYKNNKNLKIKILTQMNFS